MRGGSLTKSGRPMYYCEDRMLLAARRDPSFAAFVADIDARLQKVYTTFCFHFRATRQFARAARFALRLIALAPASAGGWRQLGATLLRR